MSAFAAYIYRVPGYDPKALARSLRYRGYRTSRPTERGQYCSVHGADFKLHLYRNEISFEGSIEACWAALHEVGGVQPTGIAS